MRANGRAQPGRVGRAAAALAFWAALTVVGPTVARAETPVVVNGVGVTVNGAPGSAAAVSPAVSAVAVAGASAVAGSQDAAAGDDADLIHRRSVPAEGRGGEGASAGAKPLSAAAGGGGGGGGGGQSPSAALYEVAKVAGALILVVGVIVGLKVFATQVLGIKAVGLNANRGIRVMSRTVIGPKQQLLLLQVGRRLVLVADSAGTMSPVAEITDPDEVAELSAQALGSREKAAKFSEAFRGNASRFGTGLEEEEEALEAESAARERLAVGEEQDGAAGEDLRGLAERVRALGRQFKTG